MCIFIFFLIIVYWGKENHESDIPPVPEYAQLWICQTNSIGIWPCHRGENRWGKYCWKTTYTKHKWFFEWFPCIINHEMNLFSSFGNSYCFLSLKIIRLAFRIKHDSIAARGQQLCCYAAKFISLGSARDHNCFITFQKVQIKRE